MMCETLFFLQTAVSYLSTPHYFDNLYRTSYNHVQFIVRTIDLCLIAFYLSEFHIRQGGDCCSCHIP
jgi:hypothetical protein